MKPIYLDHAATTPVDPRVKDAMLPYLEDFYGNPSSAHQFGQDAVHGADRAREQMAALVHADPNEIVFTGSGTEADNTAIKSTCLKRRDKGNHIITTAIEHHAVHTTCEFMASHGFEVTFLPVDTNGMIRMQDLEAAITDQTILISVMHANNETGAIQPIREIGRLAKEREILFHTDAVQTVGHEPIDMTDLQVDFLALSAHKFYGPKGVGALYIRKGTPFEPLLHGGGHEKGRRSSTLNVPGIVGLGKAADIAAQEMAEEHHRITTLRDNLWSRLQSGLDGLHLNGAMENRLANNLNIGIEHVEGESLLMNLDMEGIAVSSGSACSSESGAASHVLTAMGISKERARGSLRITLGRYTTREEIDRTVEVVTATVNKLRAMAAF